MESLFQLSLCACIMSVERHMKEDQTKLYILVHINRGVLRTQLTIFAKSSIIDVLEGSKISACTHLA